MKLSEMNTAQLAKALCALTTPLENLCNDPKVMDALKVVSKPEAGMSMATLVARVAPVLLGEHYDDVVKILSALTGKTVEAINAQPGLTTVQDVIACMDGEIMRFFTPSAPADAMQS